MTKHKLDCDNCPRNWNPPLMAKNWFDLEWKIILKIIYSLYLYEIESISYHFNRFIYIMWSIFLINWHNGWAIKCIHLHKDTRYWSIFETLNSFIHESFVFWNQSDVRIITQHPIMEMITWYLKIKIAMKEVSYIDLNQQRKFIGSNIKKVRTPVSILHITRNQLSSHTILTANSYSDKIGIQTFSLNAY